MFSGGRYVVACLGWYIRAADPAHKSARAFSDIALDEQIYVQVWRA